MKAEPRLCTRPSLACDSLQQLQALLAATGTREDLPLEFKDIILPDEHPAKVRYERAMQNMAPREDEELVNALTLAIASRGTRDGWQ